MYVCTHTHIYMLTERIPSIHPPPLVVAKREGYPLIGPRFPIGLVARVCGRVVVFHGYLKLRNRLRKTRGKDSPPQQLRS